MNSLKSLETGVKAKSESCVKEANVDCTYTLKSNHSTQVKPISVLLFSIFVKETILSTDYLMKHVQQ